MTAGAFSASITRAPDARDVDGFLVDELALVIPGCHGSASAGTLLQRLHLGVLAALDQRIQVRYALAGMPPGYTAAYIEHHCAIAPLPAAPTPLLSGDAVTLIHNAVRGPQGSEQPVRQRADGRLRQEPRRGR